MAKKTAVLAVNPVNGSGLFQYIEAFYENGIPYMVFAVADTPSITTNSGYPVEAHDTVANLKGRAGEFDALVFACGDAVPQFAANADKPYNRDMLEVITEFGRAGKILAGHCAAALMFETAGQTAGKTLALHPFIKGAITSGTATDDPYRVDGNILTAQTEQSLNLLIPHLVEALK